MSDTQIIDTLKKFGSEFQYKCIACLLGDKIFIERISDILDPKSFETDAQQWIVQTTQEYFIKYKDIPTLNVFKIKVDAIESDILRKSVVDQLKIVYQKISDKDVKFVKETFLEFCKNQKIKSALIESVDYMKLGDYERIKKSFDEALKAGMERNVGHEYMIDIDKRMSVMARDCVKTNWNEIDSILDGGLAAGELGVITSCAGGGKCVGPNTEIEIEYMETGISIKGNSGKEYILWFKPFDKFEFDGKMLYGWQIDNILFELEKLKLVMLEEGNMQKKN